ncbi:serine/Arginine-related protein 53 isoform X3 [Callorhinchus milii]|uniref:serine/Arginine-related protein 53 isoform X3 n=1 Tax=Callorhinchus milii TaxID=7868 RepID=UPI001C3F733C|nr:serine/Arginine-related protein 53 isoform X3 [Callorhinchus milii]
MGHYSSDSEDDSRSRRKKKYRRRSTSSSSSGSRTSSRKKSSRKSRTRSRDRHSPSRSKDRRRRRHSSSSSSYEVRKKRSSRSRSRDRGKSYRSRRSRSRSRNRRDPGNIKARLEHLPPAEQAKARLQLVLQAAAKADELLKAKERKENDAKKKREQEQTTIEEQVKRVKDIEAIERDSFVQQTFRSNKDTKKSQESTESEHESAILGTKTADYTIGIKQEIDYIPSAIKYQDDATLAHPSLFVDKKEAEEKWFKRLITLRQEKLMGSPVSGF